MIPLRTLILLAIVGWFFWYVVRTLPGVGSDFEIIHRPGKGTVVKGRIPASKLGEVREFFERDLKPKHTIRVRGSLDRRGFIRLAFSGRIGPFQRQRVRNFLNDLLR